EDDWLRVEVQTDDLEGLSLSVKRCEGGKVTVDSLGLRPDQPPRVGLLRLPAGRYFAEVRASEPAQARLHAASLKRSEPACGVERDAVVLPPDEHLYVFRRWVDDDTCEAADPPPWCPEGVSVDLLPSAEGS